MVQHLYEHAPNEREKILNKILGQVPIAVAVRTMQRRHGGKLIGKCCLSLPFGCHAGAGNGYPSHRESCGPKGLDLF